MSINYKTILDLEQKSQISNADLLMVGNEGTGELKQIAWKDAVKDISVDLDGYAKTTDLPTKTSQLVNDSGFLTQHQNLSAYAKTENHYTKTESDAVYLTKDYAQKTYAQKAEIPAVPTKTSQLTNDSGFLTQHQDLSAYAKTVDHYTKTESDNKYQPKGNYLTQHQDLSHKADQKDLESHVNDTVRHMTETDYNNINALFYDVEQLQERDVQPDILQNDMTHPAYIMNNPFEIKTMKGNTLSWNGDKTGKLVVEIDENSGWVLVAEPEVLPTEDHVSKGVITESVVDGKTLTYTIDYFTQIFGDAYCSIEVKDSERTTVEAIEIVYDEGGAPDPRGQVTLPRRGIYFKYTSDMYVSSVTFNHPDLSVFEGFNAVLPGEHLPDGVPYVVGGLVELFPETELVSEGEAFIFPSEVTLVEGESYTVKWNGVEYVTKAAVIEEDGMPAIVLGNFGLVSGGESTGEPFILVYSPEAYSTQGFTGMVMPLDDSESVTMSIVGGGKEVHKLPNECLDLEWIPTSEYVEFAKEKIVTSSMTDPTDTKGGFPDVTIKDVHVGQKLRVYLNGEAYDTEVKVYGEFTYAGNLMGILGGISTGEPFALQFVSGRTNVLFSDDTVDIYNGSTMSVYTAKPIQMPEEFLPDNVITDEKVDSELSKESLNPVQNKVVAEKIEKLSEEKADQTTFDGHVQNDNIHVTSEEKQTWNNKATTEYVDSEINDVKAQMVQQTPLFANSIEECTDTTKVYVLPDGYIYAYMYVEENAVSTNLWTDGDVQVERNAKYTINLPAGEYVVKGTATSNDTDSSYCVIGFYSEGVKVSDMTFTRGVEVERTVTLSQNVDQLIFYAASDNTTSLGDTATYTGIVITRTTSEAGYYWKSTGHAFVPTDYEDRIIALENEVDEIKEELESVEKEETSNLFDNNAYRIINKNSNGFTTFDGYASSAGLTSNNTYITYMFTATENTRIYSISTTSDYYSIALFSGEPSASTFLARYRASENNIPTVETQVDIASGTVVAVTITKGASPNFEIAIAENNVLSNDIKFNTSQKNEIASMVENRLILQKTGEVLKINIPSKKKSGYYLQFGFLREVNSAINLNQYRLKSMYIVDSDFAVRHTLKDTTEIEGVITESGSSDYIGGYHGDETYEFCTVLVDGIEKPMDGEDYNIACDTLDIVVKSTINAVNDLTDKVFTRYKHIVFNGNTLIIENKWIALRSASLSRSYMTMMSLPILSGDEYIAKYCRNNISYSVQQTDGTAIEDSPFEETKGANCIEMWSDILYVKSVSESSFAGKTEVTGFVATEQYNTAKAYFMQNGAIEAGQQITGKSHYTFIV